MGISSFAVDVIEFDASNFSPAQFQRSGIVCPETVARSVRKRQAEYYFGRLAARMGLSRLAQASAHVGSGPFREPLWPKGITGSITHSERYAAAVVTAEPVVDSVGIDIESIVSPDALQALLTTALSQSETSYLQQITWLPVNFLVTTVFSAKESFFKAAFPKVREYFDFSAVSLVDFDETKRRLCFRVDQSLGPEFAPGQHVELGFDRIGEDNVLTYIWLCSSA